MTKKLTRVEELNAKLNEYGKLYRDKYGYGWKLDGYVLTLKANQWVIHHCTNQDAPVWSSRYSTTIETVMREYLQTGKLNEAMLRTGLPPQKSITEERPGRAIDSNTNGTKETSKNFQQDESLQLPLFESADSVPQNPMTQEVISAIFAQAGFSVKEVELHPAHRNLLGGWYVDADVFFQREAGAKYQKLAEYLNQHDMQYIAALQQHRQQDGIPLLNTKVAYIGKFPTPESVTAASDTFAQAGDPGSTPESVISALDTSTQAGNPGSTPESVTEASDTSTQAGDPGSTPESVTEASDTSTQAGDPGSTPESVTEASDTSTQAGDPGSTPESVTAASDTFAQAGDPGSTPESVTAASDTSEQEIERWTGKDILRICDALAAYSHEIGSNDGNRSLTLTINREQDAFEAIDMVRRALDLYVETEYVPPRTYILKKCIPQNQQNPPGLNPARIKPPVNLVPAMGDGSESVTGAPDTFTPSVSNKDNAVTLALTRIAERAGFEVLKVYQNQVGVIKVRVKEDRALHKKSAGFKGDKFLSGFTIREDMLCNVYAKWTEIELETIPESIPVTTPEKQSSMLHTLPPTPEPDPSPESVTAASDTFAQAGDPGPAAAPTSLSGRKCAWCSGSMEGKRAHAKTCSDPCRKHLSRLEKEIESIKEVGADTLSQLKSAGKIPLLQSTVVSRIDVLIEKLSALRESVTAR